MNHGGSQFSATQWSVVLAAAGDSTRAERALAELCGRYWYPIYVFARRQGLGPADAEDAAQGFFAHLIQETALARVDPSKGRFRSFLLASMKNFLANERDRARAAKRGGGRPTVSWDATAAEERYRIEPADEMSPDKLFDRRWAFTVLEQTLAGLGAEMSASGKGAIFEAIKPAVGGGRTQISYTEIGSRFGMSEAAVKVAVHRARHRYGELLREAVAQTVARPDEVEDELRHLISALAD